MLKRLITFYEINLAAQQSVQESVQPDVQEKKKRGRPKK
jgi:hypothetical protein